MSSQDQLFGHQAAPSASPVVATITIPSIAGLAISSRATAITTTPMAALPIAASTAAPETAISKMPIELFANLAKFSSLCDWASFKQASLKVYNADLGPAFYAGLFEEHNVFRGLGGLFRHMETILPTEDATPGASRMDPRRLALVLLRYIHSEPIEVLRLVIFIRIRPTCHLLAHDGGIIETQRERAIEQIEQARDTSLQGSVKLGKDEARPKTAEKKQKRIWGMACDLKGEAVSLRHKRNPILPWSCDL